MASKVRVKSLIACFQFGFCLAEFLYASADAAVEYAKIGKCKRASAIFIHALNAIHDAKPGVVSEATHILVLLSYAEVLAQRGRVAKRYVRDRSVSNFIHHNQACNFMRKLVHFSKELNATLPILRRSRE